MIAGERVTTEWQDIQWTRYVLWFLTAAFALGGGSQLLHSPVVALIGLTVAASAFLAARGIGKCDDRGWWLALAVIAGAAIQSVVQALLNWAISPLFAVVLLFPSLRALLPPPGRRIVHTRPHPPQSASGSRP